MTFRKILFWSHLGMGTCVGVFILSIAVSGILMTFEPQMVSLTERHRRTVAPSDGGKNRMGLESLLEIVSTTHPGSPYTGVTVKSAPHSSVIVNRGADDGLFVNPYSGEVMGGFSRTHRAMNALLKWHRWFGIKKIGKPVTGVVCVVFSLLLLSGLYLWSPKKWTASALRSVTVFNPRLTGKARDWNWHNAIGFWCAPMILVTTLTGLIISYSWANGLLYRLTGERPPTPQADRQDRGQARPGGNGPAEAPLPPMGLDGMMSGAAEKVPGWTAITLRFPSRPDAPWTATIVEEKRFGPPSRSQVTFDSSTGQELKWEPASGQALGKRLRAWAVPLHTGRAWGLIGQIIAGLSSLGAVLLVWTGLSMAWLRYRQWRTTPARDLPLE